jgi:hypothetical protein
MKRLYKKCSNPDYTVGGEDQPYLFQRSVGKSSVNVEDTVYPFRSVHFITRLFSLILPIDLYRCLAILLINSSEITVWTRERWPGK